MSVPPPDSRGIRISDADRERAAARLHQALAEGRITIAELEERVTAVYVAVYAADLRPPLADLPGDDIVALPVVATLPAADPLVLRVGASGLKRNGKWSVPARMRVQGTMGSVVLDFCAAAVAHPVVEIELALGSGSATLLVPKGATANVDALVTTMGSVRSTVASPPRAGAPHFVVRGRTRLGSVIVRRGYGFAGMRF